MGQGQLHPYAVQFGAPPQDGLEAGGGEFEIATFQLFHGLLEQRIDIRCIRIFGMRKRE